VKFLGDESSNLKFEPHEAHSASTGRDMGSSDLKTALLDSKFMHIAITIAPNDKPLHP
jgi:hypothetical protein